MSALNTPLSLLEMDFQPITIDQHAVLRPFLRRWPQTLSAFTFSSLVAWADVFHYRWHWEDDTALFSFLPENNSHGQLLQPVGAFGPALQAKIIDAAQRMDRPLQIFGVTEPFLQKNPDFVMHFTVEENREHFNYIYLADDLANLPGKKYSKKRNHLAQAARQYQWTAEPLTPAMANACLQVADDIATKRSTGSTLEQETQALEKSLGLLEPLQLQGLLVRVDGEPAAFSIFDRLDDRTAVVQFERALRSRHGLYQVVNQETAKLLVAQGYTYINREEDMGDPGLRKAKLSYYPTRLDKAFALTWAR